MCSIAQSTEVWLYFILVAAGGPALWNSSPAFHHKLVPYYQYAEPYYFIKKTWIWHFAGIGHHRPQSCLDDAAPGSCVWDFIQSAYGCPVSAITGDRSLFYAYFQAFVCKPTGQPVDSCSNCGGEYLCRDLCGDGSGIDDYQRGDDSANKPFLNDTRGQKIFPDLFAPAGVYGSR